MIITCNYCNQTFEKEGAGWPGDVVPCPFCKMDVQLPKAQTVNITQAATEANRPGTDLALSRGHGDFRPVSISDDEILPSGAMLGQYRVTNFIGRGGMGAVYRAKHSMLQRDVAIKVLPPKFAKDPEFVQRFQREALALANLSHPNIVAIHDMGTQGEIYFFVMEFVDGVNLRDILSSKKLTPEQALKIVPQLCDALEYAHSKNIIHRDIKPENIILDRSGVAKVADFGLAKIIKGETATSVPLTQTNVVMGTVEYMAPEQREALKNVDHRADIYSMGVVLYEMLTGELPIGKFEPPSKRVQVDVRIDDVVLKALEKEPGRRYQRASHMGTEVTRVGVAAPVVADWPILDARTRKSMGVARGRRVAIRSGAASLAISGWDRPEVAVEANGSYHVEETAILLGDADEVSLFVPAGAEVVVIGADEEVTATGLVGSLSVQGGADIHVAQFEGRLDIKGGGGDIDVHGLKGESVDIHADAGSITVGAFEFTRGRAAIESSDGDVSVETTSTSSYRYQVFTRSGDLSAPGGAAATEKSASGTIGAGAGSLSVRSGSGDVSLGSSCPIGERPLKDVFTTQQIERLGVFAIVNLGLWIFFVGAMDMVFPAICVTVFWGMSIALDLWKSYVRGGAPEPKKAGIQVSVQARPDAPAPVPPVPVPPPLPADPLDAARGEPVGVQPRWSAWPFIAFIAALPAVLALIALGISGLILVGLSGDLGRNADEAWIGLASCGFAALLTGVISLTVGMAAGGHLREAKGALKGRGLATVATAVGMTALLAVLVFVRPALEDVKDARMQARAIGEEFIKANETGDAAGFWALVSEEARGRIALREFQAALSWAELAQLRYHDTSVDTDREHARAALGGYVSGQYRMIDLPLVREGGNWRVEDVRSVVRAISTMKGEGNDRR